jgi:hypothetical protein
MLAISFQPEAGTIHICRLTVLAAADALDKLGNKQARGQIAAAKVCIYVPVCLRGV